MPNVPGRIVHTYYLSQIIKVLDAEYYTFFNYKNPLKVDVKDFILQKYMVELGAHFAQL